MAISARSRGAAVSTQKYVELSQPGGRAGVVARINCTFMFSHSYYVEIGGMHETVDEPVAKYR